MSCKNICSFVPSKFTWWTSQMLESFLEYGGPPSVPILFRTSGIGTDTAYQWYGDPPWSWKNLRELNFHREDGSPGAQKLPNQWNNMSRSQENLSEFFFIHYCGRSDHFYMASRLIVLNKVYFSRYSWVGFVKIEFHICQQCSFTGSTLPWLVSCMEITATLTAVVPFLATQS